MEFYQKEGEAVLKELNAHKFGLSSQEANNRLKQYGANVIKKTKKVSPLTLFINQFKNFIIYVLIAAAVVSFILGERIDAIAIGVIVILNAILGFIQEFKAEKAIEALKKLSAPKAKVIRDGKTAEIDASQIVPGDVIIIEEGSFIPADARLLEVASLAVDESTLTGESAPVNKNGEVIKKAAQVSSQKNMVFAGTIASRGRGEAIVVATGFNTELGKIAKGLQDIQHEATPLQKQLASLGKYITIGILVICVFVFGIDFFRTNQLVDSFINAVALAVAAIPEGLPAIITITLAMGTRRMLRRNALIRRLHAVETLGSTSVICADKTGTITKNQMTVLQVYADNKLIDIRGKNFVHEGDHLNPEKFSRLFQIGVTCNNATLEGPSDPTEKALLLIARDADAKFKFERIKEIPFSSETKFMATLDKIENKQVYNYKGAPEVILKMCASQLVNGKEKRLTAKDKEEIEKAAGDMASSALRVLAFAYTENKSGKELTFVGLMGMLDPPRDGVREAVALCKKAGIRVVMITGDHLLTAQAVAAQIGINGKALTGEDVDKLSEEEFNKKCDEANIYARVSPQHKLKILTCLQNKGNVVAMTGDGVNDALALKKANIGIATGTSTDVAKEASDMVLMDDNFISIVNAVQEGRGIYDNLKKFIHYLLSCNLAEVLIIFVGLLIGLPIPLLALQILWVNLLTDGLPALALGIDPVNPKVMLRAPRSKNEKIIGGKNAYMILLQGVLMTIVTLGLYWWYLQKGDVTLAQTVAFTTVVVAELYVAINYHLGESSLFSRELFKNKWLWLAIGSSFALQLLVVYVLDPIFKTEPLMLADWMLILGVSSSILVLHQVIKKVFIVQEVRLEGN